MANRLVTALLRSFLLFVLSLILVAGFYFHASFYTIGLYPLLLVGGLATFLVITAARLIVMGDLPRGRPTSELSFPLEEGDRVLRGVVSLTILPLEADAPHVGQVVRARYDTGTEFGRLVVTDGSRRFLGEVSDEEARKAGHRSASELRDAFRRRRGWGSEEPVALLEFRRMGAPR